MSNNQLLYVTFMSLSYVVFFQSTYDSRFGHFFNMSSVMDQSRVDGVSKVFFDASKLSYR